MVLPFQWVIARGGETLRRAFGQASVPKEALDHPGSQLLLAN